MWDTTRTIKIFHQVWKMSVTKKIILFQCASAVISHYISGAGDNHNHHLTNNERLQAQHYLKYVLNYYLTGKTTLTKRPFGLAESSKNHGGLLDNAFRPRHALNKCPLLRPYISQSWECQNEDFPKLNIITITSCWTLYDDRFQFQIDRSNPILHSYNYIYSI